MMVNKIKAYIVENAEFDEAAVNDFAEQYGAEEYFTYLKQTLKPRQMEFANINKNKISFTSLFNNLGGNI